MMLPKEIWKLLLLSQLPTCRLGTIGNPIASMGRSSRENSDCSEVTVSSGEWKLLNYMDCLIPTGENRTAFIERFLKLLGYLACVIIRLQENIECFLSRVTANFYLAKGRHSFWILDYFKKKLSFKKIEISVELSSQVQNSWDNFSFVLGIKLGVIDKDVQEAPEPIQHLIYTSITCPRWIWSRLLKPEIRPMGQGVGAL